MLQSDNYITETRRNNDEDSRDSSLNKLFKSSLNPLTNRYNDIFFKRNLRRGDVILEKEEEDDKSDNSRYPSAPQKIGDYLKESVTIDKENDFIKRRRDKKVKRRVKELETFVTVILAKKTKLLIKIVDFVIFCLIVTNISLSIYENNIFTSSTQEVNGVEVTEEYYCSNLVNILRWVNILLVVLMDILILVRYCLSLRLMRQKNMACQKDGLISTGLWKYLLIEMFILSIFSPPYVDTLISGKMLGGSYIYTVDAICNFLIVFKLYYTVRIYTNCSIFLSERSIVIGLRNKLVLDMSFAVKSQLKKYPYISLCLVFCISVGVFGLTMRTFEYGYTADPTQVRISSNGKAILNPDFKQYLDAFWLVVITMMTVGYGDIYPETHLGRLIAFLACVVGMFLVSWLIISLSTLLEFNPEENKALCLIKVQKVREELERQATYVVKSVCQMHSFKKSIKLAKKTHFTGRNQNIYNQKKITCYLAELFILRSLQLKFLKQLKIAQTISLPSDDILRNLKNKLNDDIKIIKTYKKDVIAVKNLTSEIIKQEEEIFQGMKNIKFMQDALANFLVKYNNKMHRSRKHSSKS